MSTNVALFGLCVFSYVFFAELFRFKHMRALKERVILEKNRNRFGEMRTRLVRLAEEGNLHPRSPRFAVFYRTLTALMRNPYELEKAAQFLLNMPVSDKLGATVPTRQEGQFALELAKRLDLLCRDYSRTYALSAWILDRAAKRSQPPLWSSMLARRAPRRAPSAVAARKRLELAAQHAA